MFQIVLPHMLGPGAVLFLTLMPMIVLRLTGAWLATRLGLYRR